MIQECLLNSSVAIQNSFDELKGTVRPDPRLGHSSLYLSLRFLIFKRVESFDALGKIIVMKKSTEVQTSEETSAELQINSVQFAHFYNLCGMY